MRIACLQVNPGDDVAANLERALQLAADAVHQGARLLLLPEFAMVLHASGRVMRATAATEEEHPALPAFRAFAREHHVWIVLGSLTIATGGERIANRCFIFNDGGEIVARYDKLHMFDATLPDGRAIRESGVYQPGDSAIVVDALGRIVAEAGDVPGVLLADIALDDAARARARMPTLQHDRPFDVMVVNAHLTGQSECRHP